MTDSKVFQITEGINGKFEIKYIQFGKKDKTEPSTAVVTSINNESNLQVETIHLNNTKSNSKPPV